MEIKGSNCMQVWKDVLNAALNTQHVYADRMRRSCMELNGVHIVVTSPNRVSDPARWLAKQDKWIYPDLHEITEMFLNNSHASYYTYSYANRIFGDSDQINNYVIPLLQKSPDTRRAIVTLSDPAKDKTDSSYSEIPSILIIDFKLRDDKLHIHAYIRSCDLFVGFPANVYQIHALQQFVANRVGCDMGELHIYCSSGHIFEDQIADIKSLLQ